jgi:tRNA-intron endonuclease
MNEKVLVHINGKIISSNSQEAFNLFEKSRFGEKLGQKILYMPEEAMYLFETGKLEFSLNNSLKEIEKTLKKIDKDFPTNYLVYRDMRQKGYLLKTALKFGSMFRVYEKSKKISEEHAKWLLTIFHERDKLKIQEFTSKNRVAHSTKKQLLLAIVDTEGDISYYESKWVTI